MADAGRHAHRGRPTTAAGFTLLEVMVSLAILSVSLVAILNLHSGSVRTHNQAKHLTVATLLARSKMIDIEEHLLDEGLPEFNDRKEGNFEEEGYPGYTWTVEIVRPELGLDATDIQGMLGAALGFMGGGGDEAGGMLGGIEEMVGGGIEGMIQGQVQTLLDTLQEAVREVRLTIGWTDVVGYTDFSIVTHVVRMEGQGAPGGAEERQREALREAGRQLPRGDEVQVPSPGGAFRDGSDGSPFSGGGFRPGSAPPIPMAPGGRR